jgi:hypothetical protein
MQGLAAVIADFMHQGITFRLTGEGVSYRDPHNKLTQANRDYLSNIRSELKSYLLAESAATKTYSSVNDSQLVPSLTQECWWSWVKDDPNQIQNNRIRIVKVYRDRTLAELLATVRAVIASNDALRTHFEERDGELIISLNEPDTFKIDVEHLDSPEIQNADFSQLLRDFCSDLPINGVWLAKVKVLVSPDALLLLAVFHHCIVDGFSIRLLSEQLDGKVGTDQRIKHPAFYGYANAERSWLKLSGSVVIDYWKDWLKRQQHLISPETGERLDWCSGEHIEHSFFLQPQEHRKVREISRKLRSTPMLIYLCVYAIALSKWAMQGRFPMRCLSSTRYTANAWSTVGNFNTADPLEISIPADATFEVILWRTQIEYWSALARRLPGMLTFPTDTQGGNSKREKFTQCVAATLNYFPNTHDSSPLGKGELYQNVWPPTVTISAPTKWQIPLWPIYLRLSPERNGCTGLFQFNGTIISDGYQDKLRSLFFEELSKLLSTA